jgi:hypothetical protein
MLSCLLQSICSNKHLNQTIELFAILRQIVPVRQCLLLVGDCFVSSGEKVMAAVCV